jgi:hypothetical protein
VAVTENEYTVPFVRPVTTHDVPLVVVQVFDPGVDVTVYLLMARPLLNGTDHETVDFESSKLLAATPVGASGTDTGVIEAVSSDFSPVPAALYAITRNL